MQTTIALLLDALTDAAGERLARAALTGRTYADVERDLLAVTGLPVATVQRAARLATVRHVRACRTTDDALAFVAPLYGRACAQDAA